MALTRTQMVTSSAICAALYAVAKVLTAFVPTPWGVGQFAPGVVVPAFFAVVSGPWVAAVGGGIGVFVGDLYLATFGLTNPFLSLIAGVPANFVGFLLLGWLLARYRSWRAFTWASLLALLIGNLIAATVVVYYIVVFMGAAWPTDVQVATTLGFTLFWITTMFPFVIPVVPALVRATAATFRGGLSLAGARSWPSPRPATLLTDSVAIALLFGIVFVGLMFTPFGDLMFSRIQVPLDAFWIKILTLVAGISALAFGPLVGVIASTPREGATRS